MVGIDKILSEKMKKIELALSKVSRFSKSKIIRASDLSSDDKNNVDIISNKFVDMQNKLSSTGEDLSDTTSGTFNKYNKIFKNWWAETLSGLGYSIDEAKQIAFHVGDKLKSSNQEAFSLFKNFVKTPADPAETNQIGDSLESLDLSTNVDDATITDNQNPDIDLGVDNLFSNSTLNSIRTADVSSVDDWINRPPEKLVALQNVGDKKIPAFLENRFDLYMTRNKSLERALQSNDELVQKNIMPDIELFAKEKVKTLVESLKSKLDAKLLRSMMAALQDRVSKIVHSKYVSGGENDPIIQQYVKKKIAGADPSVLEDLAKIKEEVYGLVRTNTDFIFNNLLNILLNKVINKVVESVNCSLYTKFSSLVSQYSGEYDFDDIMEAIVDKGKHPFVYKCASSYILHSLGFRSASESDMEISDEEFTEYVEELSEEAVSDVEGITDILSTLTEEIVTNNYLSEEQLASLKTTLSDNLNYKKQVSASIRDILEESLDGISIEEFKESLSDETFKNQFSEHVYSSLEKLGLIRKAAPIVNITPDGEIEVKYDENVPGDENAENLFSDDVPSAEDVDLGVEENIGSQEEDTNTPEIYTEENESVENDGSFEDVSLPENNEESSGGTSDQDYIKALEEVELG